MKCSRKNKEKTIEACRELVTKYRNPHGKRFFFAATCPLCQIHVVENPFGVNNCRGCPLANVDGRMGCIKYHSFQAADSWFSRTDEYGKYVNRSSKYTFSLGLNVPLEFKRRAKFFENLIPILEELPPERFTKKGWKFLDIGYEK